MILSITSVVLGVISILQNVKSRSTLTQKVNDIYLALKEIDQLYETVEKTKIYHDGFEAFVDVALNPFLKDFERKSIIGARQEELVKNFLGVRDILLKCYTNPLHDVVYEVDETRAMPAHILLQVEKFASAHPLFVEATKLFNAEMKTMAEYHSRRNYGDDFLTSLTLVGHHCNAVLNNADDALMGALPIMDYFHHEIKGITKGMAQNVVR